MRPDGSIEGNDNDAYPDRFEPHYREITSPDQVEIYEPILGNESGRVTTGLSEAVRYLKDNRLLPAGFEKATASNDIAVVGEAAQDPDFRAAKAEVTYLVDIGNSKGPFRTEAELWYQPIGFRWAHNLARYDAAETKRFETYYDSLSTETAILIAQASAVH